MRLVLIRHYKTEFNASQQIMGWGDSPKAKNWREDLVYVEQVLRQQAFNPDYLYSSALARARQTAQYFAGQLNIDPPEAVPQLNEVNYGALYKKNKKWVCEHYPLHKKDPDFVYPGGGESFSQLQSRSVAFVRELAIRCKGKDVLCVAHSGVVRALLSGLLKLDYAAQLKRKISHRYIGVLRFDGEQCCDYDEWGMPSGFVKEGVLVLPYAAKTALPIESIMGGTLATGEEAHQG